MKILHISDTHGMHDQLPSLPAADVLVHSGDMTFSGSENEVIDFLQWFIEQPFEHKIFIAGNHDGCLYQADGIDGLPDNIHFLQNSSVEINGIRFYGLPLYIDDDNSGRYDSLIEEIPLTTDVVVSHQPPKGRLDMTDYGYGLASHGSEKLLRRIMQVKPCLHLFGHEHSANGIIKENEIIFSNGSVLDDRYELKFTPRLINID